jgi:peptidoglycan/LPS O-acetylase OafA/YrhL
MIPAELKAHRYTELDSLRGLAASTVVFHHFCLIWVGTAWFAALDQSPLHVLIAGREAVVLFFILSGFVLCIPFSGSKHISYGLFISRRFCRIYLPFAAAVLISAACTIKLHSSLNTGNSWMDKTWTAPPTIQSVIWALLARPAYTRPLNVALWTLILEIRVSVIFPLLYWFGKKLPPALVLIAPTVLCALWPKILPHHYEAPLSLTYASGLFLGGIVVHRELDRISSVLKRLSKKAFSLLLLVSVLLFELPNILMRDFTDRYPANLEALRDYVIGAGAVGVILCVIESERLRRLLNHPILLRLGSLSYSIYLMHGTVLFILIRLCLGRLNPVIMFMVYLLSVYLTSELFHFVVDRRAVMLGRQISQIWPLLTLSARHGPRTAIGEGRVS